jgi:tetratricopeptide (TPR) repeat protein
LAGNFEKAETLLRRAVNIAQEQGNTRAVAVAQNDLGVLYAVEERFTEGERAYQLALSIFRSIGIDYETALVLRNLGSLYSNDQRADESLQAFQEASKLVDKTTRDGSALAAQIFNDQAMVYFSKRDIKKAVTLALQAMAVRPAAGRDSDLIDAQILANAGTIYQWQRRYAKAEEAYRQSLGITERLSGPSHPDAEDLYRRSLAILEQSSPVLDLRMSRTLHFLAKNYLRTGERCKAEETLAKAVEISRRHPVPDPEMPQLLEAYGDVLKSVGRTQEAQRLRGEARRIRAVSALAVRAPRK